MRKVLVVEDHPLVAEATAQLLARLCDDIEVVKAGTAREATRQLDQEGLGWSCIFLDLPVPTSACSMASSPSPIAFATA